MIWICLKNKLSGFPNEILTIDTLKTVKLQDNQIDSIPENISLLSNLEVLDLSKNLISTIPLSFGSLSNLETLDLSHNRLKVFPEAFLQLKNVKHLNVNFCALDTIPNEILELPNLKSLLACWVKCSVNMVSQLISSQIAFDLPINDYFSFSLEDLAGLRPATIDGEDVLSISGGMRYSREKQEICFYLHRETGVFYEIIGMGVDDYVYCTETCTWTLPYKDLHKINNIEDLQKCSQLKIEEDKISA